MPLLSLNIETNKNLCKGSIRASALRWGIDDSLYSSPDILLLADCIYYEEVCNIKNNIKYYIKTYYS